MGVDFLENIKKPFRKHLDRQRAKLLTKDLFTVQPTLKDRILKATPSRKGEPKIGDSVTIEAENGDFMVRKGTSTIGKLSRPPASICESIEKSGLILSGHIAEVNAFSGALGVKIVEQ